MSGALDWLSAPGPAPVTSQAPPMLKAPSWALCKNCSPGDGHLCTGSRPLQGIPHTRTSSLGTDKPAQLKDLGPEPYQPCGQKKLQGAGINRAGETPEPAVPPSPKPNLQSSLTQVFVLNQGLT